MKLCFLIVLIAAIEHIAHQKVQNINPHFYFDYTYSEEKIAMDVDPLEFWRVKRLTYPKLAALTRKYLSPPSTSVSSERLFSSTGNICSDKRSRLSPEKLEMLVYLAKNLEIVNFDY